MNRRGLGIAFDIGTTTLVGSLIDMEEGRTLKVSSSINPQVRYGRDVLSRIGFCKEKGGLERLHRELISGINRVIERFSSGEEVVKAIFVGNPVMEHLLLGLSPLSMGKAPYKPLFKDGRRCPARDLGLNMNPDATVYTFPLIGGFVGGDTVAFIVHIDLHREEKTTIAIDMGTNTEILLKTSEGIWATSAPAGPAFEGIGIRWGMMAGKGAISRVRVEEEKVKLHIIGDGPPQGICGSGFIEAVSEMVINGIVDEGGRIRDREEIETNLANRIKERKEGNSFVLYRDAKREITIEQRDIREFQLAKASIQAGIKVLLRRRGIGLEEVEKVYVTGAFGTHISPWSLQSVGIIPSLWKERVVFIEDAPLLGAKRVLLKDVTPEETERIAKGVHYTALSGNPIFEKEFLKGMDFKNKDFWRE